MAVRKDGTTQLESLISRARTLPMHGRELPDVTLPESLVFREAGSRDVLTSLARFAGISIVLVAVPVATSFAEQRFPWLTDVLNTISSLGLYGTIVVLTAGSISAERGTVADSVLSRGISRYQYFMGKWHARLLVGHHVSADSPQGRFEDGARLLDGRVLGATDAWGKHLFHRYDDLWLHVHLGLIGTFTIDQRPYAGEVPVVGQVRLRLETAEHVADLRGPNLCAVITPEQVEAVRSRLGPDPLRPDPDPDIAWRRISRSGKGIGELLMDQAVLAGVGNVYRSEVLFRHRLNPHTEGKRFKRASWRLVWDDLVRLMPLGVATGR